jgi:hypothetical protein
MFGLIKVLTVWLRFGALGCYARATDHDQHEPKNETHCASHVSCLSSLFNDVNENSPGINGHKIV